MVVVELDVVVVVEVVAVVDVVDVVVVEVDAVVVELEVVVVGPEIVVVEVVDVVVVSGAQQHVPPALEHSRISSLNSPSEHSPSLQWYLPYPSISQR